MGNKRYEKYGDPLTQLQKKALKQKEPKPDGEKRHLQIISYGNKKLVNMLCNESYSVFEKSIAKEEILRRLKNQKEHKKPKNNNAIKTKKEKWQRFEETASPTGLHIGSEHTSQYAEFISNGGDPNSCPFD